MNLNHSPPNIHVGRPNLETIFQDVRKEAEQQGVSHVGVRLWTESDGWEVERNLRGEEQRPFRAWLGDF